jgi:acetoin utilization protein AcuB
MKLSTIATRGAFTVAPGDSFDKAITLMEEHDIHHLPVVEKGRVVGMISDRDLLLAVGWKLEAQRHLPGKRRGVAGPTRLGDVMSQPVYCLAPDDTISHAARDMAERKIHAIPLVSRGTLTGIVTKVDLLHWLYDPPEAGGPAPPVATRRVREFMQAHVFTVPPKEPLHNVARLMHDKHIRHVPVVADGLLIGIVTDRDIRRACGQERIEDEQAQAQGAFYIGPTTAMEVMSTNPRAIRADQTMREAAKIMTEWRIGALPVAEQDRLVGILTDTDLIHAVSAADG